MLGRDKMGACGSLFWIALILVGCRGSACGGSQAAEDAYVADVEPDWSHTDEPAPSDDADAQWPGSTKDRGPRWARDLGPTPDCQWWPQVDDPCGRLELPKPGMPCEEEGQIRCTNEMAWARGPKERRYCFRPYFVLCEKDTSGALRWVLHHAEPVEGWLMEGYATPVCQENRRGAYICPEDLPLIGGAYLCEEWHVGPIACDGGPVYTCAFADELAEKGAAEHLLNWYKEVILPRCPGCANCLYAWPLQVCPDGVILCPEGHQWISVPGRCGVDEECNVSCVDPEKLSQEHWRCLMPP